MSQTHKYIPATQTPIMETAQVQVHGWLDRLDRALSAEMSIDDQKRMRILSGNWCSCAVGEVFASNGHELHLGFEELGDCLYEVDPAIWQQGVDFDRHIIHGEYAEAKQNLAYIRDHLTPAMCDTAIKEANQRYKDNAEGYLD